MRCLIPATLLLAAAFHTAADSPPLAEYRFSASYMDRTASPGTDFYQYACGTWLKANKIPGDRASWGPSDHLAELNLARLRGICEEAAAAADPGPAQRMVGDFFASALDESRRNELAFRPLAEDLARVAAASTLADISSLIGEWQKRGMSALFSWYVDSDSKQSDRYALHFYQGGILLPDRDYYLSDDFTKERQAYEKHIRDMLLLLGDSSAEATRQAVTILRLETDLAKVSKPAEDLNDAVANYHKFTSTELTQKAPGLDWAAYWKALGTQPESLVVGQPEFLAAASKLLSTQSPADWKTYLRWQLVTNAASALHAKADALNFEFFGRVIDGKREQSPLWKRAISAVDDNLGDALGQVYAGKYFPPAAKARMQEMVTNITAVYADRIRTNGWMTPATREKALAKLQRFRAKLGYPDKWKDYAGLQIRRGDHYGNLQRALAWEMNRQLSRVGQTVDRDEWMMTTPTVNAYFNQNNNEIVFPAGILQPPFFDLQMDDAVNYGATGAVIGHELTHGFDSEGRKFDAEGNLADWWTEADTKEYERRAQVLVDQFNRREALPGLKVNGKLTLPENIADLGGILLGYEALQRALTADPAKRKAIEGFTPEQRYFISYAQSWVQLARDELLRRLVTSDSHAPDRLRAVVPLQNFQPFYDAFGLKADCKLWLAPKDRAVIW